MAFDVLDESRGQYSNGLDTRSHQNT